MKYIIAALLMTSSFAMATQCYDDTGAAIVVPDNKRIVMVPKGLSNDKIVIEIPVAQDLPKADGSVECREAGALKGNIGGC